MSSQLNLYRVKFFEHVSDESPFWEGYVRANPGELGSFRYGEFAFAKVRYSLFTSDSTNPALMSVSYSLDELARLWSDRRI